MFQKSAFMSHEGLHLFYDAKSGLRGLIAIHSTALGPASGGCRVWDYTNEDEMIRDGLRLSYGMSMKNAFAGLDLGGGKGVIWANRSKKTPEMFEAFGRAVDSLNGRYITAEDVGVSVDDMEIVASQTRHVAGTRTGDAAGNDPSPHTALGVFLGLKATCARAFGNDALDGRHIAVQGIGSVGRKLCELLAEAGARITLTDINTAAATELARTLGAEYVTPEAIYDVDADVFSPNALGAIINAETLPKLKVRAIAGGANNQLATPEFSAKLAHRNILYAPDFAINGGGIINVASEVSGTYDIDWVNAKINAMVDALGHVLDKAVTQNIPTEPIAIDMAQARIDAAKLSKKGA